MFDFRKYTYLCALEKLTNTNMEILKKEKKYKWEFANIGGSSRVKITKGEDIAHLHELDPKMWTILSCPITGLEIDDKSLKYMDYDGDGKLRVNDVVAISKWITSVLKNTDLLPFQQEMVFPRCLRALGQMKSLRADRQ